MSTPKVILVSGASSGFGSQCAGRRDGLALRRHRHWLDRPSAFQADAKSKVRGLSTLAGRSTARRSSSRLRYGASQD
jgi:NAD(P)-dependent dehydrogenase (short-subunit alcohol dehydrogenase family)